MRRNFGFVSLLLLSLALLACRRHELVHDLSEAQANELQAGLFDIDIESEKVQEDEGTWMISIAREDLKEAVALLNRSSLAKVSSIGSRESSSGLFSSKESREFRLERSTSGAIEDTLLTLDSVQEARVHLNISRANSLIRQSKVKGSASVLLVVASDSELESDRVAKLVAGAAGIAPEFVTVWITEAQHRKELSSPNSFDPLVEAAPSRTSSDALIEKVLVSRNLWVVSSVILGVGLWFLIKLTRKKPKLLKGA